MLKEKFFLWYREQNKFILYSKVAASALLVLIDMVFFITPVVLLFSQPTFLFYILLLPCHVLPILSVAALFIAFWSLTVSAVMHLMLSLFTFGYVSILLTFVTLGASWRMAVFLGFFFMIISVLVCVIDFIKLCKQPTIVEEYIQQEDVKI